MEVVKKNMIKTYFLFFAIPAIGILILVLLQLPIVYLLIGKKYDKKFNKKSVFYDVGIIGVSFFIRNSTYTSCIAFGTDSRFNQFAKKAYGGFDFKGNSSKLQIIISKLFVISNISLGILMLIAGTLSLFIK